jgi:nicotinamide mononucleotide adenylyltransferase|tara:strand:+ start:527 stop:877 length:351 start_codon:yes stop_codon:yes gene_type:complete
MKYSLFIGRWQPWHDGHQWLIDQRLNEGKNVCIAIRNEYPDETHEWFSGKIAHNLEVRFKDLIKEGRIKVIIIPDIESVNYGRGVGYDIIEHVPPTDIKEISATKIREQMRNDQLL